MNSFYICHVRPQRVQHNDSNLSRRNIKRYGTENRNIVTIFFCSFSKSILLLLHQVSGSYESAIASKRYNPKHLSELEKKNICVICFWQSNFQAKKNKLRNSRPKFSNNEHVFPYLCILIIIIIHLFFQFFHILAFSLSISPAHCAEHIVTLTCVRWLRFGTWFAILNVGVPIQLKPNRHSIG